MEWTAYIDGYCERLTPAYWAEPINAVTNAAFLIAALVLWRRLGSDKLPLARAMVILLFAIGIGSFLFHTHAQVWSAVLDVLPIALFILLYLFVALFHFWNLGSIWASVGTLLFFPYAIGTTFAFNALPFLQISAAYWPVAFLILAVGFSLRNRHYRTSNRLVIGAGLLMVSLVMRSLDGRVCTSLPIGTHFLWHLLNAIMLGWMIETYRQHMLAQPLAER